jgi:hypothetical protein
LIVGDPLCRSRQIEVLGALLAISGTLPGAVRDLRPAIATLHAKSALAIVAADLLALTLWPRPRTRRRYRGWIGAAIWGADGDMAGRTRPIWRCAMP